MSDVFAVMFINGLLDGFDRAASCSTAETRFRDRLYSLDQVSGPGPEKRSIYAALNSRFGLAGRAEARRTIDDFFDACQRECQLFASIRWRGGFDPVQYVASLPKRLAIVKLLISPVQKAIEIANAFNSKLEGTRIMLALSIYQARTGQWPQSLAELVPSVLPELPNDPVNGLPFGYRVLHDDSFGRPYLLYSLGLDATDDAGNVTTDPTLALVNRKATGYDCGLNLPRPELDE